MNEEEIFLIWAPDESPWSRWAKPVLFAHLAAVSSRVAEVPLDVSWSPPPSEKVALVLDLPGAEGVMAAMAFAALGYRPVPLYNAVPLPFGHVLSTPLTGRPVAAVDLWPTLCALRQGAETLAQLRLPPEAPPAFLLDARRGAGGRKMAPHEFDNRSVSFTTDFPSANFLAAHGIERVLLVQKGSVDPRPDLAHSLRRWQDAGFMLERKRLDSLDPVERFEVARPSWYGCMFQRVLASLGLARSRGGGFGAWVPESSAGG
jgi:hypothetical protein